MVTKLVIPDVQEKKLNTCLESKMIWSMFWNVNLFLLDDFFINKEALWVLVSLQDCHHHRGLAHSFPSLLLDSFMEPVNHQGMSPEKFTDIQILLLSWNKIYILTSHLPMYFSQVVSGLLIALNANECYTHKYYAIFLENYNKENVWIIKPIFLWIQRESNINSYLFSSTKSLLLNTFIL